MQKKTLQALNKLYTYNNAIYDPQQAVSSYPTHTLSAQHQSVLEQADWQANELCYFTHESVNAALITLRDRALISQKQAAAAFIAGVGGQYPRGLSTLGNYYRMLHATVHPYQSAQHFQCCRVCGCHDIDLGWDNVSYIRYAMYLGHTYDGPVAACIDLQEFATVIQHQTIEPNEQDIHAFRQLLHILDQAPADETPGQFEKRLTSLKYIKGIPAKRRGILHSLSLLGIVPNTVLELYPNQWTNAEDILNGERNLPNTRGRSDMEMPWAGWKGNLRVNWDKAHDVFAHWL